MREAFIVIGVILLGMTLRSAKVNTLRKLGAFAYLLATALFLYVLTGSWVAGVLGGLSWFFLPWVELLTRIRRMRLPIENRLSRKVVPNPSFFPHAKEAAVDMEEAGFEHALDCGWEWNGMKQSFQLFWNPEEKAVGSICLCEQSDVAFAYISVTSLDRNGNIWRSTNFPFSPTLLRPPGVNWNQLSCKCNGFHQVLDGHRKYLERLGVSMDMLSMPYPEEIQQAIESEIRKQVEHNLSTGIIRPTGDGHFLYSKRGLFFLWGQYIKDMVRFC